ncbi:ABC transporter ATP-binding protein [Bacillus sp. CBEL-1]|uniref:ABC transporter ATP-binding protein n=1 Tax=Bacillus sp. CBEL-1 TaxID=2502980 RepID=UPI0010516A9A|nr:ABC transporter ATP-binding protein [Bacillus sp. CBEL-1]TDB54846.1 ABC transporter ATP-binding protein [Bacillus sp. CBEL-1]
MNVKRVIEGLNIEQYLSIKDMKRIFVWVAPYVKRYKIAYIGLFVLLFVDIAVTLGFAWFFGNITDAAVHSDFEKLKWFVLVGIGLSFISIVTNFIDTYLEAIAINAVKRDVNLDLYKRLLLLSEKNISNKHSGELVSHFTNDIHKIEGVIGRGLINLIRFPVISIAALIYLTNISWKLSLFSLSVAPVAMLGGAVFGILLRNNSRIVNELISQIIRKLNDTFQGLTIIRSFTLENVFFQSYGNKIKDLYNLELKETKIKGWFYAGGQAVGSTAFLISLVVGAYFVTSDVITIGALLTFVNLINHLISPLTGLAGQWAGYQRAISALERIVDVFEQPITSKALPTQQSAKYPVHHSEIEFRNVSFKYNEGEDLFSNLNLKVPAGKVTAIVGPSGGGKSTLFKLLQRFYEPDLGCVLIDSNPLQNLSIEEVRNSISYVPQETFLFSDTVRENLKMAKPCLTDDEMYQASRHANIHQDIEALANGYDTEVGERGSKLSGGQRQRVAIARALLKDAPILLLDEATSALDNEAEHLIKESLSQLMKNRTTLIIAHRLSTIQHADFIVVMDQGKIVQVGAHTELIKEQGLYRELHDKQFFKEEPSQQPITC